MKNSYFRRIARVLLAGTVLAVFAMIGGVFVAPGAWAQQVQVVAVEGNKLSFPVKKPKAGNTGYYGYTGTINYSYKTADGTATAGTDYDATTGTVSFGPGTNVGARIYVKTKTDSVEENTETVQLRLHDPEVPGLGGYVQYQGSWVHVETLLPQTRTYAGYIYDSSFCSGRGARLLSATSASGSVGRGVRRTARVQSPCSPATGSSREA